MLDAGRSVRPGRSGLLLVALVALLVLYAVGTGMFEREAEPGGPFAGNREVVEDATAIVLKTPYATVELEREEGRWFLQGADVEPQPARTNRIESILRALLRLDVAGIAGEGKDVIERLRVDARGDRIVLSSEDGGELALIVGVARGDTVFLRREGSDRVYRVRDTVTFYLDRDLDYWRELRVLGGVAEAHEVRYASFPDGAFARSDPRSEWRPVGPPGDEPELDSEEITDRVRMLVSLEGATHVRPPAAEPEARSELELEDGRLLTIAFYLDDGVGTVAIPGGPGVPKGGDGSSAAFALRRSLDELFRAPFRRAGEP